MRNCLSKFCRKFAVFVEKLQLPTPPAILTHNTIANNRPVGTGADRDAST